jgi:carbamoyl-phosphate synthase small subunit
MGCTDRSTENDRLRVLAVDCGGKRNIYRHLADLGCDVIRVSPSVTPEEIRAASPDGLFVSNGPGDPAAVTGLVETLSQVAGEVPTFGICLGHQLLALALGASTWKLPFGHRGANQPVSDLERDRVEITSQNHGFCVDEESLLAAGCVVTHVHLNDRTVAGFRHAEKPIFAVQFHPEASPGPHDSSHLFEQFVVLMDKAREVAS